VAFAGCTASCTRHYSKHRSRSVQGRSLHARWQLCGLPGHAAAVHSHARQAAAAGLRKSCLYRRTLPERPLQACQGLQSSSIPPAELSAQIHILYIRRVARSGTDTQTIRATQTSLGLPVSCSTISGIPSCALRQGCSQCNKVSALLY